MPVLDAQDDELEAPYAVPTHLEASETIGPIPHRLWAIGLAGWVSSSMLLASTPPGADELTRVLIGWAAPAAVLAALVPWWLNPPPEHGLATMLRHLAWPRLLDPDRLGSYQRMHVADGALHTGQGERCLTVWRLPQVNLSVASAAAKRRHRAQWGAFLDGLGQDVTIIVRARRLCRLQAMYEVFEHGSDEAKALAKWLQGHLGDRPLIARDRLLVIAAPDPRDAAQPVRRHPLEHGAIQLAAHRARVGPRPGAAGQRGLAAPSEHRAPGPGHGRAQGRRADRRR